LKTNQGYLLRRKAALLTLAAMELVGSAKALGQADSGNNSVAAAADDQFASKKDSITNTLSPAALSQSAIPEQTNSELTTMRQFMMESRHGLESENIPVESMAGLGNTVPYPKLVTDSTTTIQETELATQPGDNINETLLAPMKNIGQINAETNALAKQWFDEIDDHIAPDEFAGRISALSQNTEIDTIYVESLAHLKSIKRHAQYDLRTGKIKLFSFAIQRSAVIGMEVDEIRYLRSNIKKMNSRMLFTWGHEAEHEWVNNSISLLGYSFYEVLEHFMRDEERALLSEFIKLRRIYLKSGNIRQDFPVPEYATYLRWLGKHKDGLTEGSVSGEEADFIMNLALKLTERSFSDLSDGELAKNIRYKISELSEIYSHYFSHDRDCMDKEKFAAGSFGNNSIRMLSFGDINLSETATPAGIDAHDKKIAKLVARLCGDRGIKNIPTDFPEFQRLAEKFLAANANRAIFAPISADKQNPDADIEPWNSDQYAQNLFQSILGNKQKREP
jgi:hypothetical protein